MTEIVIYDTENKLTRRVDRVTDDIQGISWIPAMFAPYCMGVNIKFDGSWYPGELVWFSSKGNGLTSVTFEFTPVNAATPFRAHFVYDGREFKRHFIFEG